MIPNIDRVVQYPNRFQLVPVSGTTDQFDLIPVPGIVEAEGKPINKLALDEFLSASGTTSGTASALTLAQDGLSLFDGATVRIKLHTDLGAAPTLNINGTGAIPLKTPKGTDVSAYPEGTWLTFIYNASAGNFILQGEGGGGLELEDILAVMNAGAFNMYDIIALGEVVI